ncbi:MAG: hypothetical protein AB8H12_02610 [Lewinella sp.]
MAAPEKNPRLSNWLDNLQQESWQLELIISGVVIFLMLGAYGPIMDAQPLLSRNYLTGGGLFAIIGGAYFIFLIAYYALLIIFIIHLILRGFWIGAIGLRSVSGDFDYDVLDYQPKFNSWLRNHLGSFDDYIERLEVQCSVAFSFAFLIFFSVLSVGAFTLVIAGATFGIATVLGATDTDVASWKKAVVAAVNLISLLFGLIYLIDFTSLGWFKKKRWLQPVYFPFYRVMGWLTLARFYRPFYYNMIDHPFGRKLVKRLWLIVFGTMVAVSVTIIRNPFYPTNKSSSSVINEAVYLDNVVNTGVYHSLPSLASRYAERDYLEVFLPYLGVSEDQILIHLFPDLAPALEGSFAIDGPINMWSARNRSVNNDSLLVAHRAIHRLYLNDSLLVDVPWQFYEHPVREQQGLLYDLPVYDLPRGRHILRFEEYNLSLSDSLYWDVKAEILFVR